MDPLYFARTLCRVYKKISSVLDGVSFLVHCVIALWQGRAQLDLPAHWLSAAATDLILRMVVQASGPGRVFRKLPESSQKVPRK